MKTTGVVRRIDDLGRIVIPKEIRRTLRIREGESLEIYVDKDIVALKKYSPMNDLEDFAKTYVECIHSITKQNIIVTDRDTIIASAGSLRKKYLGKSISKFLDTVIDNRENIINKEQENIELSDDLKEEASYTLTPIIVNGDAIGSIIILSMGKSVTDIDVKIAQVAAQFIGKHIEE